jgi:hypothetical protein
MRHVRFEFDDGSCDRTVRWLAKGDREGGRTDDRPWWVERPGYVER